MLAVIAIIRVAITGLLLVHIFLLVAVVPVMTAGMTMDRTVVFIGASIFAVMIIAITEPIVIVRAIVVVVEVMVVLIWALHPSQYPALLPDKNTRYLSKSWVLPMAR